jgi:lipoate-protein ligase A
MNKAVFYCQSECDPYYNMACDEWMFRRVIQHPTNLYLRLYGWSVPTITFGVNQQEERALDFSLLGDTPVIRRITGGRALYHDRSELTYSIAVNLDGWDGQGWAQRPSDLHRVVAEGLTEFIRAMGKSADYCRRSAISNSRPDFFHRAACFASHARYEIVADEQKVVASAARRIGNAVLQHGAIKLAGVASHPALHGLKAEDATYSIDAQPINEEEATRASGAFQESMARSLGVDAVVGSFSDIELTEQNALAQAVKQSPVDRRFLLHNLGTS